MNAPKVLLAFLHRPMCVGIFYASAFRQAGCDVKTVGPGENMVYNISDWPEYRAPDFEVPVTDYDVDWMVKDIAAQSGWTPDLVVMIDQFDFFYLKGETQVCKFAWVAIENFNDLQVNRLTERKADAEFHCINHQGFAPSQSKWITFGADPFVHPRLNLERTKSICQIGTFYQPRGDVANYLRSQLDPGVPVIDPQMYLQTLQETDHTIFGRVPSYKSHSIAYNRSRGALSCSNVDFVPMRAPEAFSHGCVLFSDNVYSMRHFFGDPWPGNPDGIWVNYDPTNLPGLLELIRHFDSDDNTRKLLVERATDALYTKHLYVHRARMILEDCGIETVCKFI